MNTMSLENPLSISQSTIDHAQQLSISKLLGTSIMLLSRDSKSLTESKQCFNWIQNHDWDILQIHK